MNYDLEWEDELFLAAINRVWNRGFRPVGKWRFEKGGKIYDLSTADLNQLERIEREGLFLVEG